MHIYEYRSCHECPECAHCTAGGTRTSIDVGTLGTSVPVCPGLSGALDTGANGHRRAVISPWNDNGAVGVFVHAVDAIGDVLKGGLFQGRGARGGDESSCDQAAARTIGWLYGAHRLAWRPCMLLGCCGSSRECQRAAERRGVWVHHMKTPDQWSTDCAHGEGNAAVTVQEGLLERHPRVCC